jgi:hypothetical protein
VNRTLTPAHEYAEIFPFDEQNIPKLAESIKKNGQRRPIVLLDGKVLEGRRRERACIMVDVEPAYCDFGDYPEHGDDPFEYVIDENLWRRHLTEEARALAAAKYATHRGGKPAQLCASSDPTNAQAAARFKVPQAKLRRAKNVLAKVTGTVLKLMAEGTATISDANRIADQPKKLQNRAAKAVREGLHRTLAAAAEAFQPQPGDGAEGERRGEGNRREEPQGKPVYDWKKWDADFGRMRRSIDDICTVFKEGGSREEREALQALERFHGLMLGWRGKILGVDDAKAG